MDEFKVLTVANRKGGAGKSTCAAHLAAEAVKRNYKTILIDLDPQKTLEGWWSKREGDPNPYLTDVKEYFKPDPKDPLKQIVVPIDVALPEKLAGLKQKGFNLCIIDTPGDTSINAKLGIEVADLVIIPSKPTAPDLKAIGRTIHQVNENKKSFIFVVTQAIPRANSAMKAVSILAGFGPVAPSTIGIRVAYENAMGAGTSAAEEDAGASKELKEIWSYIETRLFNTIKEANNGGKEKI